MSKLIFLWTALLLMGIQSPPDNITVSGIVLNATDHTPLAGASVLEKGTKHAAVTDKAGHFTIVVSGPDAVLEVCYVGFETQIIKLRGRTSVKVELKAASNELADAVVVGYGATKKRSVTGSVTSVPAMNLGEAPNQETVNPARVGRQNSNWNTEGYDHITDNPFRQVNSDPVSTFAVDVDPASYSNVRRFLRDGQLPPAGAVRIEEMINYFHYDYPQPKGSDPVALMGEMGDCPWNPRHKLVLVGMQGKKVPTEDLKASNLVFLIDVSGSMWSADKLPLVKASLKLLVDQLRPEDLVTIVTYAGNAGLALGTTTGEHKQTIKDAIDQLEAGGSTAGGEGIQLAYQTASDHFIHGGNNRVILCTDGDFNVGVSSNDELVDLITKEKKTGVYLTVLGFGKGNYQDSKMQALADKGNGNHAYIDGMDEAKRVLLREFGSTLFTIAKDVKLQVEFNPEKVQAYRLIGYENRMLNREDFTDDTKDGGEMGSGHTVTALYEVIPQGVPNEFAPSIGALKYQEERRPARRHAHLDGEWLTVRCRYKLPDSETSQETDRPLVLNDGTAATDDFRFVTAVAEFGMLLRQSPYKQQSSYAQVLSLAGEVKEDDRKEFIALVEKAETLAKEKAVTIR